jgi:hypothetical protein
VLPAAKRFASTTRLQYLQIDACRKVEPESTDKAKQSVQGAKYMQGVLLRRLHAKAQHIAADW